MNVELVGDEKNLEVYYRVNEGFFNIPSNVIEDLSGNDRDGALNGITIVEPDIKATVPFPTTETWTSHFTNNTPNTFTSTEVDTGTERITVTAHPYIVDERVQFTSTGTLPTGLSAGTKYFIRSPTANDFQVYTTASTAALDITGVGSGSHQVFRVFDTIQDLIDSGYTFVNEPCPLTAQFIAYYDTGIVIASTRIISTPTKTDLHNGTAITSTREIAIRKDQFSETFAPGDVNTTNDDITMTSHPFSLDDKVQFSTTGGLPDPLSAGTDYFVVNPNVNDFQVSLTIGGTAVNFTTQGTGTHTIFTPWTVLGDDDQFGTNFRYVRVTYDITATNQKAAMEATELFTTLRSKIKNDAGRVEVTSNPTSESFNVSFLDVTSINLTYESTASVAKIPVLDFDDVPGATGFDVHLFTTTGGDGSTVGEFVRWSARGF
jgi:hypothetical protein